MEDKKKSFIKGLFLGIGCTLITALLGITIYGCASVNAKGTKAFGQAEVNICFESGDEVTTTDINHFGIKYSTFAVSGSGDNYHYFLYSTVGDWEDVLGTTDFDADAPSIVYGNFTRTGDTYYIRLDADLPSSVDFMSPSFVRVYQNGAYLRDLAFVDGSSELYTFSASGTVGFETYINLEPASGSVDFYYNEPLFEDTSSSSSGVSSTSEPSWVTYSFSKGIYPGNLGTEVSFGNVATINDHNGETDFWVYIPVSTEVNGLWYDRIGIHYGSLRKWLPYNGHGGNSLWQTEFLFLDGSTRKVSLNLTEVPYNWFFCFDVSLERYVSTGASTGEWQALTLAKTPDLVWDGNAGYQDTRLQWVYYVNSFSFAPYSLDDTVGDITWNNLTSGQALALIGGLPSGYNPANPDLMDAFGLIGQAFAGFQVVFNMQVFPFATLGAFLCVPLVVAVILFVVRLFKR